MVMHVSAVSHTVVACAQGAAVPRQCAGWGGVATAGRWGGGAGHIQAGAVVGSDSGHLIT